MRNLIDGDAFFFLKRRLNRLDGVAAFKREGLLAAESAKRQLVSTNRSRVWRRGVRIKLTLRPVSV